MARVGWNSLCFTALVFSVALGVAGGCKNGNNNTNAGPSDFAIVADLATPSADLGDVDLFVPPDLACEGTGGCYSCAPASDPQFLNHCTSATCSKFDNKARLPLLLANGGLPPLP